MAPPMSIASASFIRFCTTSILSETFAAQNRDERAIRMRNGFAEIGQLLFHQQTGSGLAHELGDADDGCVSAMGGAERIANKHAVAERRKFARKFRVVGFF